MSPCTSKVSCHILLNLSQPLEAALSAGAPRELPKLQCVNAWDAAVQNEMGFPSAEGRNGLGMEAFSVPALIRGWSVSDEDRKSIWGVKCDFIEAQNGLGP